MVVAGVGGGRWWLVMTAGPRDLDQIDGDLKEGKVEKLLSQVLLLECWLCWCGCLLGG